MTGDTLDKNNRRSRSTVKLPKNYILKEANLFLMNLRKMKIALTALFMSRLTK